MCYSFKWTYRVIKLSHYNLVKAIQMRVGRISNAEYPSEEALRKWRAKYAKTFDEYWPTAEYFVIEQTGPTSATNITILPEEEAAK